MRSMQLGRRFGQNVQFGLGSSGLGRLAPYLVSRSDPFEPVANGCFGGSTFFEIGGKTLAVPLRPDAMAVRLGAFQRGPRAWGSVLKCGPRPVIH